MQSSSLPAWWWWSVSSPLLLPMSWLSHSLYQSTYDDMTARTSCTFHVQVLILHDASQSQTRVLWPCQPHGSQMVCSLLGHHLLSGRQPIREGETTPRSGSAKAVKVCAPAQARMLDPVLSSGARTWPMSIKSQSGSSFFPIVDPLPDLCGSGYEISS